MTENDAPIDLEDVPPEEDDHPEDVPNRDEVEEPVSLADAQTPEDR